MPERTGHCPEVGDKVTIRVSSKRLIPGEVIAVSDDGKKYRVRYQAPWGGTTSGWYPTSALTHSPTKAYPFSK